MVVGGGAAVGIDQGSRLYHSLLRYRFVFRVRIVAKSLTPQQNCPRGVIKSCNHSPAVQVPECHTVPRAVVWWATDYVRRNTMVVDWHGQFTPRRGMYKSWRRRLECPWPHPQGHGETWAPYRRVSWHILQRHLLAETKTTTRSVRWL